jgi:acyl-CoA thioesterase-1
MIERKLIEEDSFVRIINAGISGDTAEEGNARVDWVLQQRIDYFVLELGLNDIFQGASIEEIYQDLASIIKKVQTAAPETKILLTELSLPRDFDNSTNLAFTAMYQTLAKELDVVLIDGFLKGVMDVPELNLPDGLHPNAKGQQIIAENVWRVLGPMVL